MRALIYWGGFLLYTAVLLAIGWRGYRQTRMHDDAIDFWAAGKRLGAGAVGLSISASFMSISWSCVYAVQLFYWYGISALWLVPVPWLLTMLGFYLFTPRFRSLPAFSQPEIVATRYGRELRKYIALPVAAVFLVWGGAEIYAAATVLQPLLQAPFHLVLGLIALIVAAYSYLGGFAAVVMTDKIQFALVAFFIISIAWISGAAVFADNSLASALASLPAAPKTRTSPLALLSVGWPLILVTFIAYLPGWLIETDIWVRIQAAGDTRQARRGVLIAGVNSLLFLAVLPLFIGLAALLLYPPVGTAIPAPLQDGAAIFAVLMQDHAPIWLNVLLTIGLAAAAMSTIDTCGNVVALSLSYDVFEPRLAATKSRINRRMLSRLMSAGAVFLAYVYALFTESLWDIFYLSSGILTTTVFLPIAAVVFAVGTARQVKWAAAVGFIGTLLFYMLETRGVLGFVEPGWIEATGLGYIVFSLLASMAAFVLSGMKRP